MRNNSIYRISFYPPYEILQKFVSQENDYRLHGLILKYCYESGNPLCPARQ